MLSEGRVGVRPYPIMGGAVSSGRDNDELIDNLIDADYIKTKQTEHIFRAVDRGNYYVDEQRSSAYKDGAWRHGHIHLSAPCIYTKVVESLELKPGLSFLNLGSGTGYLSTMVGLIIGGNAVNHGVEYHQDVIDFAKVKLDEFIKSCPSFDEFDFCPPTFVQGNFLKLSASGRRYDRVYCGSGCNLEAVEFIKSFMSVGGFAIIPFGDQLLRIKRLNETEYKERNLHSVAFASLIPSGPQDEIFDLPELEVKSLKTVCRSYIRNLIRQNIKVWTGELDVRRRKPSNVKGPAPPGQRGLQIRFQRVNLPVRHDSDSDSSVGSDSSSQQTDVEAAEPRNIDSEAATASPMVTGQPTGSQISSSAAIPVAKTDRTISEGADSGICLGTSVSSGSQSDRISIDREFEDGASADTPSSSHHQDPSLDSQELMDNMEVIQQNSTDQPGRSSATVASAESSSPAASSSLMELYERRNEQTGSSSTLRDSESRNTDGSPKRSYPQTEDTDSEESSGSSSSSRKRSCSDLCFRRLSSTNTPPESQQMVVANPQHEEIPEAEPEPGINDLHEETDSDEDSEVELDDEQSRLRIQRRREVMRSLIRALNSSPEPRPATEEEDQERMHNREKAKLYHASFADAMRKRINSLPIPPSLKDYLQYYRNQV